jgi:hypothetical protein
MEAFAADVATPVASLAEVGEIMGVSKQAVDKAEGRAIDMIAPAILEALSRLPSAWERMTDCERRIVEAYRNSGRNLILEGSL